jgi:hypothetical protein
MTNGRILPLSDSAGQSHWAGDGAGAGAGLHSHSEGSSPQKNQHSQGGGRGGRGRGGGGQQRGLIGEANADMCNPEGYFPHRRQYLDDAQLMQELDSIARSAGLLAGILTGWG